MNDLTDVTTPLYEEYEQLIVERDQLRKEAGSIWAAYLRTFGKLMTESFQAKIECIRKKKTISYVMRVVNSGENINLVNINKAVQTEMGAYEKQLDELLKASKESLKAKISTEYTVRKVKQIYRRIANMIHPDVYPEAQNDETIRNLWKRTQEAYHENDLKSMEELYVLVQKAVKGMTIPLVSYTPDQLKKKISDLKIETDTIKTTDPYRYKDILEDDTLVSAKTKELNEEIKSYKSYLKELDDSLTSLLKENGTDVSDPGTFLS